MGRKEGFLKDRVIPTYEVAKREVGLQPLYDNPVDLMVQSLAQERKFLAHLNVVDGAMKDGLLRNITKEMPIDRATEDYLKDSRGNLLNLKGRGVLAGPKDFVRILNNYASPSKMGPFARAIMAPINFINFARVSFSAFHPNFIANADLATSTGRPLVDGLYSLFTGDGHGLKTAAGRLAKAPINPVLDYFKASHTFEALAGKEYPGAESDIALFRESGARVPSSRTSLHIGSELQRLSKLNVEPLHKMLGAALVDTVKDVAGLHPIRTFKDVEKIVGESVMGYIVPRVKAGTQMRLYAEGLEDLAKAKGGMEAVTAAERDSLGFDIENHLNDTMGQIPHDQLYFTNALKNWARFIFAYPTWQLGTFRLAASGAKGAIGSAINLASEAVGRGSPIELTGKEKLAAKYFVGAALVHGIESAIANYVMTGEMPRDHHDFIAARTGKKDANGNDIRPWQSDYFRSYYALRHPVQALFSRFNPVVSKTHELLVNMDYNGNRIYTPGASWSQQSIEMGKSVAETPLPFSYQNIKSMKEQSNITPSEKAHMIMGWTPVPRNYRESNAEGLAHTKFLNSLHALTPAEMEIMKNSAKLSQMFRDKDPQAKEYAKQMLGSGQLTMREVENAAKKSGQRAFVHEIQRLSTKDVFEVWDAAKKEDNAADLKDIQARVLTYLDDKRPGGLVVRIAKDFRTTDPTLIKQQIRKIRDILIYKQQKKETSMEARAP